MSYQYQKNGITGKSEIVINGFEKGIADSPYQGIADIRNFNITTSPNQANVEFAMAGVTLPPTGFTGTAFTANSGTDILTTASTTGFYNGMALTIVTTSGAGGLTNGRTYYVGDITPTTFKLYDTLNISLLVDITVNISGTFTVYTFGNPSDSVSSTSNTFDGSSTMNYKDTYILDSNGLCWNLSSYHVNGVGGTVSKNTLQFLGNLLHSSSAVYSPKGIVVFKGYLFVFMDSKIDYARINFDSSNPTTLWVYAWKNITTTITGHRAIAAVDNTLYFCNDSAVGSVLINAGSSFDPTNAATYTYNTSALALPSFDKATCLAQLGVTLLVGGMINNIYPWDRVSTSFSYPLVVAESYIKCIVSTNSTAYIFAGNRGRIYITNGANIDLFKKFPDSISDTTNPYYQWGWAIYLKNQLFFSLSATTNDSGTTLSKYAGVWAYDLNSGALRLSNSLSYGTYAGTVPVIVPMGNVFPTGEGIYAGWINSTGGIDYTSANPYTNYEARIDTDIIPVGSFYGQKNFTSIEFKLSKPMVSGESIKVSWRSDLTSSFTLLGTTTTAVLSDVYVPNFKNLQWLQLRIESSSTATNPTYVPLLEVRIRE